VIENDYAFAENRRRFYENHYRVAEPIDPWHAYAQRVVHSTTKAWFSDLGKARGERVLNAGSGGSDYGIDTPMVHLDLTAERITQFPNFIVGDISTIPIADASFDVVLCVGSVLNYGNPILAIKEFQRVLRPGGLLVLEYERSGSPEYWSNHGTSSACVRVETFYGRVKTQLWAYGDEFIDGLLTIHAFSTIAEIRFHGLSSLALAITASPRFASRCVIGDRFLTNRWPIRYIASNRMLAVEKFTQQ
jgi:SAM-dependent methyltransferase